MEGVIKAWAEELESESSGASAAAADGESKETFAARQAATVSTLASARLDCCRTVHKIAQNIVAAPDDARRRRLRAANKKVRQALLEGAGGSGRAALDIMGFIDEGADDELTFVLGLDASLDGVRAAAEVLPPVIERLTSAARAAERSFEIAEAARLDAQRIAMTEERSRARNKRMGRDDFNPLNPDRFANEGGGGFKSSRPGPSSGG
eukprot:g1166.t1